MKKKFLALFCAGSLLLSLVACGTPAAQNSTSSSTSSSTESSSVSESGKTVWDAYTPYEQTVTFTKSRIKPSYDQGFTNGDTILNNPYTRYMEKTINVKTNLAWEVDSNNYDQKLSLSIASGDIPDMLVVNRKIYKQLVENNLIQDMSEAYNKCISPFLKEQYDSYGDRIFEECTVDGKLMGIPGTQIFGQNFSVLWVRTDYLKKVGMEMPKTMEDVWKVAKAFKDSDVSGTGKTVGLTLGEKVYDKGWTSFGCNTAFFADGAYPGWWVTGKDGKAVFGSVLPEMKTTLKTLSDMYKEGTLDKEFAVRKNEDRSAMVASGQTGMYFGNWWPDGSMGDCVVNNKDADWAPVVIAGTNGKIEVPQDDPVNGIIVVNKNYKHPEAIVKALNVSYDCIRGQGDGKAVYEDILKNSPTLDWGSCAIPLQVDSLNAIQLLTDDLNQALKKGDKAAMKVQTQSANYDYVMEERNNPKKSSGSYTTAMARTVGSEAILPSYNNYISIKDTAYFGQTETMTSKWANLQKLETEMMVQIIMGEKPLDYFDKFVTQWYALGGQTITDEVNADMGK